MPEFICNRTVVITAKGHCVVLRKGEPSYKARQFARKLGIDSSGMTGGELSDAIDATLAARKNNRRKKKASASA